VAIEPLNSLNSKKMSLSDIKKTGALVCGSRFFAKRYPDIIAVKQTTDHDYFIQYDESLFNELQREGFKAVHRNDVCVSGINNDPLVKYPFDDDCVAILSGENCQLLMRNDAVMYSEVIHSISGEFYRDYIWKSGDNKPNKTQIRSIFNQLFKAYYVGKGVEPPVLDQGNDNDLFITLS
jgi:hypothetical protein